MKKFATLTAILGIAISTANAQLALYGWGSNSWGALGNGATFGIVFTPTQIGTANWLAVDGGLGYSVGIQSDGTLWAWGTDTDDQLGNGTTSDMTRPGQISTATDWQKVSCGLDHTVAIKSDHTLWGWGNNIEGGLGTGNSTNLTTPTQIGANSSDWAYASAGEHFTLAIKTNGTLWGWGDNNYGELGDGSTTDRYNPVQIGTDADWKLVATSSYYSFGIKNNGTLWAWGDNSFGGANIKVPTQVGTESNWKTIASLDDSHFAIKTDGTLWAWGDNITGQLGIGTNVDVTTITQAGTATDWLDVAPGADHTILMKTDHTIWGIGLGAANGQTASSNTPMQIGTDNTWGAIAAGSTHAFAIKSATTAVQEIARNNDVTIYPNPAEDFIHINASKAIENIRIQNLTGQVMSNGISKDINVSRLASGIYVYQVVFKNGDLVTGKFTKK